jgi:hypothetical protein
MLPISETPEVLLGRKILKDFVDLMRADRYSDEEIAYWIENEFSKHGFIVYDLFDSTAEMADFTGVPSNTFSGFFMH